MGFWKAHRIRAAAPDHTGAITAAVSRLPPNRLTSVGASLRLRGFQHVLGFSLPRRAHGGRTGLVRSRARLGLGSVVGTPRPARLVIHIARPSGPPAESGDRNSRHVWWRRGLRTSNIARCHAALGPDDACAPHHLSPSGRFVSGSSLADAQTGPSGAFGIATTSLLPRIPP